MYGQTGQGEAPQPPALMCTGLLQERSEVKPRWGRRATRRHTRAAAVREKAVPSRGEYS